MRKLIGELISDTYKQTIDDNKEDFIMLYTIITKLCMYLLNKNVLSETDIKDILDIKKVEKNA